MYLFVPESLLPFYKLIQKTAHDVLGIENSQLLQSRLMEDPRTKRLSDQFEKVDDVHVKALVNAFNATRQDLAAARFDIPDFIETYKSELEHLLPEVQKTK